MSEGDRHGYITFGWIATIIGLLLFFAVLESKYSDAQKSSEYAYKCAEQYQELSNSTSNLATSTSNQESSNSTQKNQPNPDWCDLTAQQSMAESTYWMNWAAWGGVIFTGVAAFLIWQTLLATRDAVTETRRIGEAQVRAYLGVFDFFTEITDNPRPVIKTKITFKNTGDTPAKNVRFNVKWGAKEQFNEEWHPKTIEDAEGRGTIGSDSPFFAELRTDTSTSPEENLNRRKIKKILQKKWGYWVFGVIEYDDVFDIPQRVRFRYKLNVDAANDGNIGYSPCAEGNEIN